MFVCLSVCIFLSVRMVKYCGNSLHLVIWRLVKALFICLRLGTFGKQLCMVPSLNHYLFLYSSQVHNLVFLQNNPWWWGC